MLRIEIMLLSFSFFSLKNEYIYLKIIIINYKIEREKKKVKKWNQAILCKLDIYI